MKRARTIGSWLATLGAAVLTACGAHAEGEFHARGGMLKSWDLSPNTCVSGLRRGFYGAELFRSAPGDDAELVLIDSPTEGALVLARVPSENRMVRIRGEECRVFEPELERNGVTVNGVPGLTGYLRLDCNIAKVGHLFGEAAFECF